MAWFLCQPTTHTARSAASSRKEDAKMPHRILAYFFSIVLLLTACTSQPQQPTTLPVITSPILTPTSTSTPENTPTPTTTPTPTPLPMAGPVTGDAAIRLGKGWINNLAFSPNGKILSVATSIGVYLYQVDTAELIAFLPSDFIVKDTVFINDKTLAIGTSNGTTVWDINATPKIMATLQRPNPVLALDVFEDNELLIVEFEETGGSSSTNVVKWDMVNPEIVNKVSSEYLFESKYSSAKNILALADTSRGKIVIVDTTTMKTTAVVCSGRCGSFALSTNGDTLAVAKEGSTFFWDTTSQKEIADFKAKGAPLAFSSDEKFLAIVSSDGLAVWDVAAKKIKSTYERASMASFSADGSLLASVSQDGALTLREISSENTVMVIKGFASLGKATFQNDYAVSVYGFGPQYVSDQAKGIMGFYSQNRKTIYFRDNTTGDVVRTIEVPDEELDQLRSVTFSPNGEILATTSTNWQTYDDVIILFDANTGKRLKTLSGSAPVAFSPDGSLLASGTKGNKLVIWDIASGEILPLNLGLVPVGGGQNAPLQKSLVFSPNGSVLAILSDKVVFRDISTGEQIKTLENGFDPSLGFGNFDDGGTGAIGSFSPDGQRLASTWLVKNTDASSVFENAKGVVILWDVTSGEKIVILEGHSKPITALTYSPDGTLLATGAKDNTIIVWDAKSGNQLKVLQGHSGAINNIAFSADGKLLHSSSLDGTVITWSLDQLLP